jgi:hypothetical protein
MEELFEKRACAYCGKIFIAHHGLQQYCPEKHGRRNFCKHAQKERVSEQRLAERAIELGRVGIDVFEQTPLDKNILCLRHIMGAQKEKIVLGYILGEIGYDLYHYTSKTPFSNSESFIVTVGEFNITWIEEDPLTFKITRS